VRQRLPYGGEVVAETLVEFVDALSDNVTNAESANVALSASVPLLRGAGMVNLEPLIATERELVYTVRGFEDFRRSFAVGVATQYFALLTARQGVANRVQSYSDFADLLVRTQALFEADKISFLEVQRAQQSLLVAENDLIDAREEYANRLDVFKIALGMPVTQDLDVVPVELDVLVPDFEQIDVVALAERYRLDLQTARDRIDDARRTVAIAENGLLPDLSISARADVGNRPGTPARQLDHRSLEYSAGLSLDLPIDRLPERNAYRRALIAFGQTQRGYDDLLDRVAAGVRQSVRAIRSARSSLRIQEQGIALARRRLEYANTLLRQGDADAREVVEAQNDLLDAQDAYERAQSNLQVQVLQFLRDTGTLRVDPAAGAIGQAMERVAEAENGAMVPR
jgi:outer membrane protein TolC